MHRTTRALLAGVLVVLLLGGGVAGASGWFDQAHFSAGVSSGTWTSAPTPEPSPSSGDGDQGDGTPQPSPQPSTPGGGQTPADRVITAGNANTVVASVVWTEKDGGAITSATSAGNAGRELCAAVVVTGSTDSPATWQLAVDLSGAPFYGERPNLHYESEWRATAEDSANLELTGRDAISVSQTRTIHLCNFWLHGQLPVADGFSMPHPSAPVWTGGTPGLGDLCVEMTVSGTVTDLEANPFFFGWSHTLDLTDALTEYNLHSTAPVRNVVFTPGPQSGHAYRIDGAGSDWMPFRSSYELSSGVLTALRGTASTTIRACLTPN